MGSRDFGQTKALWCDESHGYPYTFALLWPSYGYPYHLICLQKRGEKKLFCNNVKKNFCVLQKHEISNIISSAIKFL
jgi:hypothetical protein